MEDRQGGKEQEEEEKGCEGEEKERKGEEKECEEEEMEREEEEMEREKAALPCGSTVPSLVEGAWTALFPCSCSSYSPVSPVSAAVPRVFAEKASAPEGP